MHAFRARSGLPLEDQGVLVLQVRQLSPTC